MDNFPTLPTRQRFSLIAMALAFIFTNWNVNSTWAQSIRLSVSGIPFVVNGTDSVPVGLFGVHSSSLNADRVANWGVEMVRGIEAAPSGSPSFPGKNNTFPAGIKMTIDCYYDRFQPALYLTNRTGWKTQLENLATTYATNAQNMTHKPILEFWNEPFLNWASKPGVNYDKRWYDQADTAQDVPVRRPGFSEPEKHLVWDKRKWWVQLSPTVTDPVNFYVQLSSNWTALNNLAVGEELQIGSRRFKAVMDWLALDTTQTSYYSSFANARMYNLMYNTFARKVKEINPSVRVLGGWGMSFSNDNWRPFQTIYKSTIDSCWQWMDGIHEHHYGGDIRFMVGAYEVVNAYSKLKYGKSLPVFNTETGGFTDPQIPGGSTSGPPADPLLRDRGAFQYTFRELAFNLSRSPDKLKSRASHETHLYNGYGLALGMFRNFRGKLISAHSNNDGVWCLSALNGNKLVVAVYNDLTTASSCQLSVKAPEGFQFSGANRVWAEDSSAGNAVVGKRETLSASGTEWSQNLNLSLKSGTVLEFDLIGSLQAQPFIIRQFLADTLLANVAANGSMTTQIDIPDSIVNNASGARLKLYVRNFSSGSLLLNGQSYSDLQRGFFSYIPVPISNLQNSNTLVFSGGAAGFDVNFASIEVFKGNLDSNLVASSTPVLDVNALLEVFPNPTSGEVNLKWKGHQTHFQLRDALGRIKASGLLESDKRVGFNDLDPGVYVLSAGGVYKKVLVLK